MFWVSRTVTRCTNLSTIAPSDHCIRPRNAVKGGNFRDVVRVKLRQLKLEDPRTKRTFLSKSCHCQSCQKRSGTDGVCDTWFELRLQKKKKQDMLHRGIRQLRGCFSQRFLVPTRRARTMLVSCALTQDDRHLSVPAPWPRGSSGALFFRRLLSEAMLPEHSERVLDVDACIDSLALPPAQRHVLERALGAQTSAAGADGSPGPPTLRDDVLLLIKDLQTQTHFICDEVHRRIRWRRQLEHLLCTQPGVASQRG